MHILALQKRALEDPDKENILREPKSICELNPTKETIKEKLSNCKFLPVSRPCNGLGWVDWVDSTSSFAIVDRKEYSDIFRDKINMLDFH